MKFLMITAPNASKKHTLDTMTLFLYYLISSLLVISMLGGYLGYLTFLYLAHWPGSFIIFLVGFIMCLFSIILSLFCHFANRRSNFENYHLQRIYLALSSIVNISIFAILIASMIKIEPDAIFVICMIWQGGNCTLAVILFLRLRPIERVLRTHSYEPYSSRHINESSHQINNRVQSFKEIKREETAITVSSTRIYMDESGGLNPSSGKFIERGQYSLEKSGCNPGVSI